MAVIDYLAGKHVSLEDRNIYAKIWYNEETGMLGRRGRMGRVIYMTNVGTIPDETFVTVKLGDQIIGQIDEAFLERLRRGDVFVLGGDKYEFLFSRGMVAQVKASVYRPPTIPSWFSEMLPLSFDLAIEIGKFRRLLKEKFSSQRTKKEIMGFIDRYVYVDENSAEALYNYFREQYEYLAIPTDKRLLVEVYDDGEQTYYVFHSLFGRRVNDVLSRAVAFAVSRISHRDVQIGVNDNGFFITAESKIQVFKGLELLKSDRLELVLKNAIDKTEILKRRFRHCASRALMILRNYKGRTKRVGRQQVSSQILLNAVRRIGNDYFVLEEARREVLHDLMDIEHAKWVLKQVEEKKIRIEQHRTGLPSPFAFNLVAMGYTDLLKIEDKVEFLKRMHDMVLARIGSKKPEKLRPETYEQLWKKQEEERLRDKSDRLERLKAMAWNLNRVPMYAKEEIVNLIDGGEDIRQDVLKEIRAHQKDIAREWPKELREFVLKRIEAL
jgi:ATP-dependent Lhr-like helicase